MRAMIHPAEDLENGLIVTGKTDGKLRVQLIKDAEDIGFIDCDPQAAGWMAAQLLHVAAQLHEQSGAVLPDRIKIGSEFPIVYAHKFALAPSPKVDDESIIITCGASEIGFSINRVNLKPLAHAMIALATDADKLQ